MNESRKEFDEDSPVIDALLEEYLGGKKPRALDADTLNGIVANSTFLDDQEVRKFDFACAKAELELEIAGNHPHSPVIPKVSLAPVTHNAPPRSLFSRLALGSLAMLAACLLILASSYLTLNQQQNSRKPLQKNSTEDQLASNDNTQAESLQPTQDYKNELAVNNDDHSSDIVEIPGPLPFERDHHIPLEFNSDETAAVQPKWSADQEQVLATINSQFEQLWNRTSMAKSDAIDLNQWAHRVSLALVGKPPRADMLSLLSSNKDSGALRKRFVDSLLQSEDFVQHWANRLASQYFSLPAGASRRGDVAASRELIELAIRDNSSITGLWESFLDPELSTGQSGVWLVAHREHDAKSLAAELLSLGVGNQASCMRCHQAGNTQLTSRTKLSDIANNNSLDQFWKLAALLNKAQVQDDRIAWRMDRELFHDSKNSTVQLAVPGFADVPNLTSKEIVNSDDAAAALKSWGQWLSSSQESRGRFVETVWKGLFHMPLGGNIYEAPEYSELTDLRDFLAQEQVRKDNSLRGLIASIVLSDVFSVPTVDITESWYLVANDAHIEQLRQQMRLFSHYSIAPESMVTDNRQLVRWLATFNQPAKVLLAQPKQIDLENTKPVVSNHHDEEPPMSASQLEWLIRSKHYSKDTANWINGLSNSSMSWDMVTNHLYLAELGRDATTEELQDGKAMLEISSNRKVAIARILASLSLQ
jgi:hypothetical protein